MERRQTIVPRGGTRPRTRNQRAQNKPQTSKKGKRRTTGRMAAKTKTAARSQRPALRKKPGRASQVSGGRNRAHQKRRSPK